MNIKSNITVNIVIFFAIISCANAYREIFKWKQIDYEELTPISGFDVTDYVAYNNVPFGASRFGLRYFITVPRRRPGIPFTLNVINYRTNENNQSPKLEAYPDTWTNTPDVTLKPNAKRIISVYRTRIDVCGRLWFIDTGLLEYRNNFTQVQPPSLWVINVQTNQLIQRFELPTAMQGRPDGLTSITVDVDSSDCSNAFAYFPNMRTFNIHVYSLKQNKAWTTRHNYYYIDPLSGDLNIGGYEFQWNDGVFSVALGPKLNDGYKWAYFHSVMSLDEFRVSTRVLRNETLATRSYHFKDYEHVGQRAAGLQSNLHDINQNTGVMYYAQIQNNAVACWKTQNRYTIFNQHIVYKDDVGMIYPSDMKLDLDGNVLVVANKMPIYFYGSLDTNDYNFRVWNFKPPQDVCNRPDQFGEINRYPGRFGS